MAKKVCPIWIGWLLVSPVRKLFQNPDNILSSYIQKDMTVLDAGCAMGFFSLPAARMVGPDGKVICVDLQEAMIRHLKRRASKAGVIDRIETRVCNENSLLTDDLNEQIDFALSVAVVHEVPNAPAFFSEVHKTLKPGCKFLLIEPRGHVTADEFGKTLIIAENSGFRVIEQTIDRFGHIAVLEK